MPWYNAKKRRKRKVIIFGVTGQSLMMKTLLEEQGYDIIASFDKNKDNIPILFNDIPLYYEKDYPNFINIFRSETLRFILSMSHPHGSVRLRLHKELIRKYNCKPLTIIDPTARIAPNAVIGDGAQILANASVMERATLGTQCIIGSNAMLSHESALGNGSELALGAVVCGLVNIGDNSKVGAGAVVLPKLNIGNCVLIGANSTVTKDIPDHTIVIGSPARTYKENYLVN